VIVESDAADHLDADGPDAGSTVRHLVHCPAPAWAGSLLDGPSLSDERFILMSGIPADHPLYADGSRRFHDAQMACEAISEIGAFIGREYFGVPADRRGLYHRLSVDLTDTTAWRVGGGPARMAMEVVASPVNVLRGAPRSLDFQCTVKIDDSPCATGSAGLIFVPPMTHGKHQGYRSWAVRTAPMLRETPENAPRPVAAREVGRTEPGNVVLCEPDVSTVTRIGTWVLTGEGNPVFGPGDSEFLSGTLLLESLRQAALLTAGRSCGLLPERCTVSSFDLRFRGTAERALPLRCTAVPGLLAADAEGRPLVPVTLALTQHRRPVIEARTTVVQDF
jgi:hypothetical protein